MQFKQQPIAQLTPHMMQLLQLPMLRIGPLRKHRKLLIRQVSKPGVRLLPNSLIAKPIYLCWYVGQCFKVQLGNIIA
ncbi:hypothetical protein BKE30_00210 [Alkanindiges hydrocarboniclasticus]|uniref:Uncharacterized protein n=1 Tax=Alkanindiges hydrocarboniclasticus TaxID=1907941 RepID=A0A1S8CY34_9GAMM|nr:hypothetical protein BKE30_00210 [Alkanindiges hydrocarboniclasticus]